jgi:alpha-glucosidase
MKRLALALACAALGCLSLTAARSADISPIDPPEQGFFAKVLDYDGIPIKAPAVVSDQALLIARERLTRLLKNLPDARYNLRMAGAELHIIGKDQVTSDLPEHRHLKGKPFDGNLTVDQRTRGLGGLLTSCGEENLLELPTDRYRGRDICLHEFAHNLQGQGLSEEVRRKIREQYHRSLDAGLWKGAYAASNEGEYFAELTMWYFGTHGDLNIQGPKPENGPEGLRKYDPNAYALLDDLYSGRLPIARVKTVELPAERPARERELRSGSDTVKTSIRFVNRTPQELKLYWLDNEGKRKPYGVVPAGSSVTQGTFASHVWVLAGPDDRAVALFVAASERGVAIVK